MQLTSQVTRRIAALTAAARTSSPADDDGRGQGLAEYALILALIAIVAIVALIFLGGAISAILSKIGNSI